MTLAIMKAGGLKNALVKLLAGFNPIILIIGALIAIGVLLYKHWDEISAKAIEIWGGIRDWFDSVTKRLESSSHGYGLVLLIPLKVWVPGLSRNLHLHLTGLKAHSPVLGISFRVFGVASKILFPTWPTGSGINSPQRGKP